MSLRTRLAILLAGVLVASAQAPARAADADVAEQIIAIMNKVFGSYPATRANHAKGVVLEGTFTPGPEGAALSKASLFKAASIPVVVRFSDSTGIPTIPDGDPNANPHGMSVKFRIPGGDEVDIVANSLQFFPVATGEEFRDLLQAVLDSPPGSPKPTKIEQFFAAHPAAAKAFASTSTPASFATEEYNGVNSFVFVSPSGERRAFRFKITPDAGVTHLEAAEAAKLGKDGLVEEIRTRVGAKPVTFTLQAQLADPSDPVDDATKPLTADRKVVELGKIVLSRAGADPKDLGYLPTNLTDGIEPSGDPLIGVRTSSYAISFSRRAQ
ncbi:MAG: catalase family peroxidase [Alsobacter sp.]